MHSNKTFYLEPRDAGEGHRPATPLELMFDLAFVIAIAAAATGLHHAVGAAHFVDGLTGFFLAFAMIWIAWINYSWFASGYDDGSVLFRILSMVIMFGALIMAAGLPAVFEAKPFYIVLIGFVIMRIGMVALWVSAARGDSENHGAAIKNAIGIVIMQIFWIAAVFTIPVTSPLLLPIFLLGIMGELIVPALSARGSNIPFHREHIIERYGLLNIIVLGECFLAIVLAIGAVMKSDGHGEAAHGLFPGAEFVYIGISAAVITFALWALYFDDSEHLSKDTLQHVFMWGYGHFVLFASAAATGAGFAVVVELANHHAHISQLQAAMAVAIPVALYLISLWAIRDRFQASAMSIVLLPFAAIVILAVTAISGALALPLMAVVLILTLVVRHITRVKS